MFKKKKSALERLIARFKNIDDLSAEICTILDSEEICKVCPHKDNPKDCIGLTSCSDALARVLQTGGDTHG